MVEWTARAGEQRKVTNEGWEGENNDKKGNKKINETRKPMCKMEKGNSKVNGTREDKKTVRLKVGRNKKTKSLK